MIFFNYLIIKKIPVILKLLIPLIFGVLFQYYSGIKLELAPLLFFLLALLVVVNLPIFSKLKKIDNVAIILIQILFFFLGVFNVNSNNSSLSSNYFFEPGEHVYQLRINEPPIEKENSIKLVVDVLSKNDEQTIGKGLVYAQENDSVRLLKYGDLIVAKLNFNPVKSNGNPHEFDYGSYLKKSNIHHQGFLKSDKYFKEGESKNYLFNFTYSIRDYFSKLIDRSNFGKDNKPILKALLLGDKVDLDKETLRTYSSAGAMHVLAVSGLHVGIVMMILMTLLKPIKKIRFGKAVFVFSVLLGVWFYAFITGLSPSVLRSAIMFSFITIGSSLEREASIYQSVMVSAFVLIVLDPFVIFKVGFQLSYLAVLGIVYLQPKIYNLVYIKYKWLDYFWQITAVSIAAQIATFPLGLFYFHQFPNFFLISNLLVIPLAGIILATGLSYFVLHKIPYINDLLCYVLDVCLTIMNKSVEWVENLPYSIVWGISITWYETLLIYIVLLFLVFGFAIKKVRLLFFGSLCLILLLSIFNLDKYNSKQSNELVVYNVKDNFALDLFYGTKNIFIADSSLINDESKLLFHVQHNWFDRMGVEQPYLYIPTESIDKSIVAFRNKTLSFYSDNLTPYKTDYVIIGKVTYINHDVLKEWKDNNSVIILQNQVSYKSRNFIVKNYPEDLIHDLRVDGAFISSF